MSDLKLPQFLGIGAQKSASSWLYKNLSCHADLYLSKVKEIHFFDTHYVNGLEWYSNNFMFAGERIRGEITPSYSILGIEVIEYIKEIMPDAKLIYILRNPIDRAWSHALMEFLVVQGRDFKDVTNDEFISHFRGEGSFSRGNYVSCLDNWLSVFDKNQLFIGYYEEVSDDPKKLLTNIFIHLGVDPKRMDWEGSPYERVVFKGTDHPLPADLRSELESIYHPLIKELNRKYPSEYSPNWY